METPRRTNPARTQREGDREPRREASGEAGPAEAPTQASSLRAVRNKSVVLPPGLWHFVAAA